MKDITTYINEQKTNNKNVNFIIGKVKVPNNGKTRVKSTEELKTIITNRSMNGVCVFNDLDVSSITDMEEVFCNYDLDELDISEWDVSNVTNMINMFRGANIKSIDVSKWNVSNVKYMDNMFSHCIYLESITGIENWDVSNVESMGEMFKSCKKIYNCDLHTWKTPKVISMFDTFAYCTNFNSDLSDWDVSSCRDFTGTFSHCESLDFDASKWNVSKCNDFSAMFYECKSMHCNISNWRISPFAHRFNMTKGSKIKKK